MALLRADEQRRLQRERRRGAAGRSLAHLDRGLRRIGERDESNWTEFGLKRDHRTIENLPGGTHPGAEYGAVRGSLMMGMAPVMLDRLRLSQSADGQDTEDQEDRHEFADSSVHHKEDPVSVRQILMDAH